MSNAFYCSSVGDSDRLKLGARRRLFRLLDHYRLAKESGVAIGALLGS